jgi:hypothetical protein
LMSFLFLPPERINALSSTLLDSVFHHRRASFFVVIGWLRFSAFESSLLLPCFCSVQLRFYSSSLWNLIIVGTIHLVRPFSHSVLTLIFFKGVVDKGILLRKEIRRIQSAVNDDSTFNYAPNRIQLPACLEDSRDRIKDDVACTALVAKL